MTDSLDSTWTPILEKLRAATAGEFVIGGELGHGGMAAVFLAYDTRLNRRVAIKVMAPALLMGEGLVQRFANEAVTMANLRHANIITVFSVRQVEDIHFFVMEFVSGRPLDQIIQHAGQLPVPVARAIIWQVGSALGYAHRHGVVHRDIKPANILLDEEGNALVTDFGISKAVESSTRTQTGVLVGTPAYMSPEQCYGLPVTAACDQYALGVVAFEMLTGRAPFSGSSFSVMQAHTMQAVPALRDLRPDLPEELEQAVFRMLEKDPERRFATMRDALSALEAEPLHDGDPVRPELARLATLGDAPAAASDSLIPRARGRDISHATPASGARTPVPMSVHGSGEITPAAAASSQAHSAQPKATQSASAPDAVQDKLYLIVAEPPNVIEAGDRFELTAVVCREHGTIIVDHRVQWTSSAPKIARVDKTGVVHALIPGKAKLTASAHGLTESVTIDVRRPAVSGVDVTVPRGRIRVGDRFRLAAIPRDKHRTPVPTPVRWVSADETRARVAENGTVTALAAGDVEILAEANGIRGGARVRIDPVGIEAVNGGGHATLPKVDGRGRGIHRTVWLATAALIAVGAVIVVVRRNTQSRALDVPPPGTSSMPTRAVDTAQVKAVQRAEGRDTASAKAPLPPVSAGGVRPRRPTNEADKSHGGEHLEGATANAVSQTTVIARIAISPPQLTLLSNGRAQMQAAPLDANGNFVGDRAAARWRSSDSSVARVDASTGIVAAGTPGTATITAVIDRASGSANVTVERPIAVAPAQQSQPAVHSDSASAAVVGRATAAEVRGASERCTRALQSRDLTELIALAHAGTASEKETLNKLVSLLRDDQAKLNIAAPVFGQPLVSETGAIGNFSVQLTWRSSFGRQRESNVSFETVLARGADGWQLSSCHVVGSPRLQ
jgi:eukaryotic-like serine/threonine-protein kinase